MRGSSLCGESSRVCAATLGCRAQNLRNLPAPWLIAYGLFPFSALFHPHLTNAILSADVLIFDRAFQVRGGGQYSGVAVDSHLLVRYIDSGVFDVTTFPHLYGIGL